MQEHEAQKSSEMTELDFHDALLAESAELDYIPEKDHVDPTTGMNYGTFREANIEVEGTLMELAKRSVRKAKSMNMDPYEASYTYRGEPTKMQRWDTYKKSNDAYVRLNQESVNLSKKNQSKIAQHLTTFDILAKDGVLNGRTKDQYFKELASAVTKGFKQGEEHIDIPGIRNVRTADYRYKPAEKAIERAFDYLSSGRGNYDPNWVLIDGKPIT